jgi:hypothetical protein
MQSILVFAFFSLLMGVISSFVIAVGGSSNQLKNTLVTETKQYFSSIEKVVKREYTTNQLQATPPGWTAAQLVSQTAIQQLAPGRWGNATYDAWGSPIRMQLVRENLALSGQVVVPVTGILLVSAGPDRTFQVTNTSPSTLAALQGVVPPLGSDDVVLSFTDAEAQREVMNKLTNKLQRIADVMMRDYQVRVIAFRNDVETAYRQALLTNPTAVIPDFNDKVRNDPAAPQFADLADAQARQRLGVAEEFDYLERVVPQSGQLRVTTQLLNPSNPRDGVILGLSNNPANPSPWGVVNLSVTLRGGFNQ